MLLIFHVSSNCMNCEYVSVLMLQKCDIKFLYFFYTRKKSEHKRAKNETAQNTGKWIFLHAVAQKLCIFNAEIVNEKKIINA